MKLGIGLMNTMIERLVFIYDILDLVVLPGFLNFLTMGRQYSATLGAQWNNPRTVSEAPKIVMLQFWSLPRRLLSG